MCFSHPIPTSIIRISSSFAIGHSKTWRIWMRLWLQTGTRLSDQTISCFISGDFCLGDFGKWNRILDGLNGKIHLILGSRDLRNFRKSYAESFESVVMQMNIEGITKGSVWITIRSFVTTARITEFGNCSDPCIPIRIIPAMMLRGWRCFFRRNTTWVLTTMISLLLLMLK